VVRRALCASLDGSTTSGSTKVTGEGASFISGPSPVHMNEAVQEDKTEREGTVRDGHVPLVTFKLYEEGVHRGSLYTCTRLFALIPGRSWAEHNAYGPYKTYMSSHETKYGTESRKLIKKKLRK
jgi:hypothetical protein